MSAMLKSKPRYSPEIKQLCKEMYIKGLTISDIAGQTPVPEKTLYNWRNADDWDSFCPPDSVETALARRICRLSEKDNKTPTEIDELAKLVDVFSNMSVKLATAEKIMCEGRAIEKHGFPAEPFIPTARGDGDPRPKREKKAKAVKNDISSITPELLDAVRERSFYGYQKLWFERKNDPVTRRTRFILKSRQIGATYYFAFEALDDAIRTGDNQIFLSASRDQAEVFKAYIIAFAKKEFEVELKGTGVILLSNGAELRFLSTNSTTAQSYHGHLYIDEVFWIPNFEKINKIASGMAAHKKWRKTYFSTPSAQGHQAYKTWTGEKHNAKLPEKKRVPFDVSHAALKGGGMFPDGIWRHMVTVKDAEEQGCDLFDIAQLRLEYSKDEFDNLFMCKFIDDSQSVFNMDMLLNCIVEQEQWDDYDPNHSRPYANKPVSLGYDPSRSEKGDDAQLVVLGIPLTAKDPFRLLRRRSCRGRNFDFQANRIKEDVDLHNVVFIGLDVNGMGVGVVEHIEKFFPQVTPIHYSQDAKNRLIVKMTDLINTQRFKILSAEADVIRSFLLIKQSISNGNGGITYTTERTAESGHGDSAWAIINACSYEPLAGTRHSATVTFSN